MAASSQASAGHRGEAFAPAAWLAALLALCAACLFPGAAFAATEGMSITAVNLGADHRGDCVLVASGNDILIMDLGSKGSFDYVREALDSVGAPKLGEGSDMRLGLYISHYHGDHTGALGQESSLRKLFAEYDVTTLYLPRSTIFEGRIDSSVYLERRRRVANIARSLHTGIEVLYLEPGSTFSIGDAQAEVIGPVGVAGYKDPGEEPEDDDESNEANIWNTFLNNCSLVTRIRYGDITYLTAGDIMDDAENALVKEYGSALKADIFKLSHHAISSNSKNFLSYVQPTCSFGTSNTYAELVSASGGRKVRRTYTAKQNASAYGLCYMVGDELDSFVVKTDGKKVAGYRFSDPSTPLVGGVVATVGSYGEDRGGGTYDLNDYYYLDEDGKPIAGLHETTVDSFTGMRLFGSGGKLYAGGWGYENGSYVYDGWSAADDGGMRYFLQATATLASGFTTVGTSMYYFQPEAPYTMLTGNQVIDGSSYRFTSEGVLVRSTWLSESVDGDDSCWIYFDESGKQVYGWHDIDNATYYFDPATGYSARGLTEIDGAYYWFEDSGELARNAWRNAEGDESEETWMRFGTDGKRLAGWQTIKHKRYYFDRETGYRATGFKKIGKRYYCFKYNGVAYVNTTKKLAGYRCTFDSKGVWTNMPTISKPTLLWVKAKGKGKALAKWKKQKVTGYEVYLSKTKRGNYKKVKTVGSASKLSFKKKGLSSKTTYYFKVRSFRTILNYKKYSKFSNKVALRVS